MVLSFELFAERRPYLYHLTAAQNVEGIVATRRLLPAASLAQAAGVHAEFRVPRRGSRIIAVDGRAVHVRDQDPLRAGNVSLQGDWTFERFVEELNARVFFWPGAAGGPNSYGMRHYLRYASEAPSILRLATERLVAANPTMPPEYCAYNSGSPRCSNGQRSPRGPMTFAGGVDFEATPARVVEVTFRGTVLLPERAEVATSPNGPWADLF